MTTHPPLSTIGPVGTSVSPGTHEAIVTALVAYAAGDAFGVAYEFVPEPVRVTTDRISPRDGWPLGGVSDDTLLSILTIQSIVPGRPRESAAAFLAALRREMPGLRGLGPTTRAALGLPVRPDEQHWVGGSNGGMMRTALVGLAYPPDAAPERRAMTAALAAATHRDPAAVTCAVLATRLFSDALGQVPGSSVDALRDEADAVRTEMPGAAELVEAVATWSPAPDGVSLTPADTLGAVVHVADGARTCLEAYRAACELGGDTDTVCALAASLVAARSPEASGVTDIGWLQDVRWDEIPQLGAVAASLAALREPQGGR